MSAERIARIQDGLLTWFAVNARDLPWRRTRDPYAILVSEVMLQQTQVDRVLPYYSRFLELFPTVEALARSATAEVIRIWSGLGYNRRAVNLQRAARAVMDGYGGTFPTDPSELQRLPGIGAYTAGAVASFAYEQDVSFLDTNMRRVISRVVFGTGPATESAVLDTARELLPPGEGWAWNQALIEFGALQCTARNPACIVCPLSADCLAFPAIQSVLIANRNRKHATKAEPFETSSRYFRGRIVELLRVIPECDVNGVDLSQLGPQVREDFSTKDVPWLRNLVDGLQRDGLAVVSEESPPYDAGEHLKSTGTRVRLP